MHRRHRRPPIGTQVSRVADAQLVLALADLHRAGAPGDAVHDARRHIRQVRALLRLLRGGEGDDTLADASRRLRALNRRLAAADAAPSALDTLARIGAQTDARDTRAAIDAVRRGLAQRAERTAVSARLLRSAERVLAVERARIGTWQAAPIGLAHGAALEKTVKRAVAAMKRALARPSARRERAWRRRTTMLWLHVRLLEPYRHELRALRARLDALNRWLDESHHVTALERTLMSEALASRHDTATALRVLREYHAKVRARAAVYGRSALGLGRRAHAGAAVGTASARTTI